MKRISLDGLWNNAARILAGCMVLLLVLTMAVMPTSGTAESEAEGVLILVIDAAAEE